MVLSLGQIGYPQRRRCFCKKGTPITSSTVGFVLSCGQNPIGGNAVVVLGPKWRIHYYAHLQEINVSSFSFVGHKTIIGTVGNSGNAINSPSHLHYAIATPIPYVWLKDDSPQGWKKIFYLNPITKLNKA